MDRSALDSTLAPLLIAGCFSSISAGLVISLAGTYWSKFPTDKRWIKLCVMVAVVWTLLDTAINLSWVYDWAVTNFMKPAELAKMPIRLVLYCVTMPTAVVAVQAFYLWRCWVVSGRKNHLLVGALGLVCLGCYGIGLYMAVFTAREDNIAAFADIRNVSWGWFAGVLVTDLAITVSMTYYLLIKPRKGVNANIDTSNPLKKIIQRAIQTNLLAAVFQICIVALYAKYPTAMYYTILGLVEPKIYLGSFIASLNVRSPHLHGAFETSTDEGRGIKSLGVINAQPVTVTVRQELVIDEDEAESIKDVRWMTSKNGLGYGETATPYRVQFHQDDQFPAGEKGDVELQRLG